MNRSTTAMLAALEALIVVAIGVGIALVPLTILWATHFELAVDWFVFWRAAVDVWLLGNGVDLTVQLDPAAVTALGLPAPAGPFTLSIALLGFAVMGALFGVRTGMRAAETPHRHVGVFSAILTYGILAAALTLSASTGTVQPATSQGILLPTAIYAAGVLIGAERGRAGRREAGSQETNRLRRLLHARYLGVPSRFRLIFAGALRGGSAVVAAVLLVSAVTVAVLILGNFATIIALYESLQADVPGGISITLAQLALIPNLVIWAAAWFVGPGIAVGVGTSVSPVGTALGPLPGLPILGALPQGTLSFGFLGIVLPVLAGFTCAVVIKQRMHRAGDPERPLPQNIATGVGIGLLAGLILGVLAWWSAGAIGPGRLADVGPDPVLVGVLAAVEVGISACLGMVVRIPQLRRGGVRAKAPEATQTRT
ncbi:MAG TPA: DUF6350 family protein [Marisediminicola sp.]|jgi:hypothetical protein|nr:rane protein [Cryobacterium sp.]HEV7957126.1 DUF6350 family protein [Marisediminicola sp.]